MFGHNVLLGLTPSDIKEFLQPIIDEEGSLEGNFGKRPKLTVSDSVNKYLYCIMSVLIILLLDFF